MMFSILSLLICHQAVAQNSRPNFLIIISDDQRYDTMPFMPRVQARIFDQGVSFTRGYVTTPLCCPSRASILTGMYAHNHRVRVNEDPLEFKTFMERLHENGYYTGLVGKYLNSWDGSRRPEFDFWVAFADGGSRYTNPRLNINGAWRAQSGYITHILHAHALEFLNRAAQQTKPFVLIFAPNAPHSSADPAPGDEKLYLNLPPHRPPNFNEADVSDKPAWFQSVSPLDSTHIAATDAFRLKQLQSLNALDQAINSLLDKLAQQNQLDATLIIYLSDNGFFWGEHRFTEKLRVYEPASRVPFALRYPPLVNQPRVEERIVANIDIAPTIYELAGLPIPAEVNGRSLVPLLRGEQGWREELLIEGWPQGLPVPPYSAIHTDQFVYVETKTDRTELYDLKHDSHQLENHAENSAYAGRIDSLKKRLQTMMGMTPENKTPAMSVIISPSTATVQTPGTWRVSMRLEADSIAIGGGVKIGLVKGFGALQNSNKELPGYVEAGTSNAKANLKSYVKTGDGQAPWKWDRNAWVVTALVQKNALHKGDTIHVTFGANPPKGSLLPPLTAFVDTIRVAADLNRSGIYSAIVQKPTLEILPQLPHRLYGYLPSSSAIGTPITLKIVVCDEYDNLATSFAGTIALTTTDASAILPKTVALAPIDRGRKDIQVRFNKPGIHYVELRAADSLWQVHTNPVEISLQPPHSRVFWGDLNSQSGFSYVGYGTGSFLKAREVACLDFFSLTDHTSNDYGANGGLTLQEWEATKHAVIRYHEPGKFVTFPAYAFSAASPSGHHNIYFNATDARIPEIPLLRHNVYLQVQKLWELKESLIPSGIDMLTAALHPGIIWGPNSVITPSFVSFGAGFSHFQFRPLIEIYSTHGICESYDLQHPLSYKSLWPKIRDCSSGPYYAQDAWAAGEILAVIASSNDQTSRPGLPYNGLAAVYATELTRDGIGNALKNRRTYGTTGQRMLVHFDIDGNFMGSQFKLEAGKYPKINLAVHGTDNLDFVEVLRWDSLLRPFNNGHPRFETIRLLKGEGRSLAITFVDSTYSGAAIYYLRAKQKRDIWDSTNQIYRQAWAWSSPIWINQSETLNVEDRERLPRQLQLRPNYPNPFSRQTLVTYFLPRDGKVKAALYNTLGQQVRVLIDDSQALGWHGLQILARDLSEGVYFIQLEAAEQVATQKIVIMK